MLKAISSYLRYESFKLGTAEVPDSIPTRGHYFNELFFLLSPCNPFMPILLILIMRNLEYVSKDMRTQGVCSGSESVT